MELPDEIWTQIFDLAADEDVLFQYGLLTVMGESAWFKNALDGWSLRTPQEALNMIQRRSYATKKAIMLTCKTWRRIGSEFLFRCLFFNDPSKLHLLCQILETDAKQKESTSSVGLGWWTRRIHLTRYHASPSQAMSDMCAALTTIIKYCPNLSIFIVDWPMSGPTFGSVADALATYTRKSLRTVQWHVPAEAIPKVIWALDSLPLVLAAHIEFEPPTSTTELHESLHLGAAQDVTLSLPYLQQLSLRGSIAEFVEQAMGWNLRGLRNVSFDCGHSRNDVPDVVAFLKMHGSNLLFLDLNCIPPIEVSKVLEACAQLEVFSFNADWRLHRNSDDDVDAGSLHEQSNTMSMSLGSPNTEMSILCSTPHPRIHTIGLHGLLYAFGVGYAATYATVEPLRSHIIRRSNDLNFAALNRTQFPHLQCVRVLSRTVLNDLNKENGPRQEDGIDGMERWEKWWAQCASMGVRLEDCTGEELGRLPEETEDGDEFEDEDSEEYDSEEEEFYSDEYSDDEWEIEIPPMERTGDAPHASELRKLVEECRAMAETREQSPYDGFIGPIPELPADLSFEMDMDGSGLDPGPSTATSSGSALPRVEVA